MLVCLLSLCCLFSISRYYSSLYSVGSKVKRAGQDSEILSSVRRDKICNVYCRMIYYVLLIDRGAHLNDAAFCVCGSENCRVCLAPGGRMRDKVNSKTQYLNCDVIQSTLE